jgi:hypothetical protein
MTDRTSQIFICYAHKDNENPDPSKRWLDRLLEHLAPLELQEQADIWSDQDIKLGEEWHDKIQATLQQVKAAVLLVSPSFLASKYIRNSELPLLLNQAREQGVVILPVLLRHCLWKETKFKYPDPQAGPEERSLSSIQVPTTEPLNSLEEHKQDEVLYQVAQRIYQIVQGGQKTPEKASQPDKNKEATKTAKYNLLNKNQLLDILEQMTSTQFDRLIFRLDVPQNLMPSEDKPQTERAIALLRWAQAPGGCGLEKIKQALDELLT